MTTEEYQDADGNPILLETLCRREPEWAANVIRTHRQQTEQLAEALICPVCRKWINKFGPCGAHEEAHKIATAIADTSAPQGETDNGN